MFGMFSDMRKSCAWLIHVVPLLLALLALYFPEQALALCKQLGLW